MNRSEIITMFNSRKYWPSEEKPSWEAKTGDLAVIYDYHVFKDPSGTQHCNWMGWIRFLSVWHNLFFWSNPT